MASKTPPKASNILATPIENVEDSRAQRLQRQQSRFRDRGGIFVPSSRNKLADILLGKASPVKKLNRRSTSASPSKGRGKAVTQVQSLVPDTPVVEFNCRRSPRKRMRGASGTKGGEELAGSSELGTIKLVSKVSSRAGSKAPNEPRRETIEEEEDTVLAKSRKRTPRKGTKRPGSSKAKTGPKPGGKSSQFNEGAEEDNSEIIVKTDKKSASKSRTQAKLQSSESKRSKSATTTSPARPARAKRKTSKSRNAGVPKVPRSNKKSSLEKPASPPTQSKSKRCVPQLPDIMEEDEDDLLDDRPTTPGLNSLPGDSRNVSAPLTGKKRAIESVDSSAESPEPTQKRAKRTRTKEGKPKGKVATSANDAPSKPKVSKGRPCRTPERDASVHDVTVGKRKKASEDQLSNNRPVRGVKRRKVETETETEDESPKPKRAKEDTTGQGVADSTRRMPTKTAKRKENTTTKRTGSDPKEVIKLPPTKGLPKSVLLLIQNSSAPLVIDDEPDPIDFLSTPRRRLYV